MKKLILLLLLLSVNSFADSIYFSPSVYYTRGDYSNNNSSEGIAGYVSLGNYKYRLLLSYDHLNIDKDGSLYRQNYFNVGGILGFTNFYLKLNYGNVSGSFHPQTPELPFNDKNNLFSTDLFYTDFYSFIGGSYSYQKMEGYVGREINQVMLRFEHIPHWRVLMSVKPVYTKVSDGRSLFGVNGRLHYLPIDQLLIKLHGFIGERAYFFDPDLLILFNQDETQKYLAAIQLEYFLSYNLNFIVGMQHTSFGNYSINYYLAGIRTNFIF
jgi:hypothetical protein